ncbi:hypothetical protein BJ508DRAFT_309818 [Ascobolus immersus RN42]|uniref:Uncharacterized protein n=1 Tax=Ascobolus immersus RN42 TaxID=1160509 RepID=A0A3N4HW10_ASCIM|nr:hypothetical protein BJ508DRAFT_309818 [Ascobolus immersus RN42]
MSQDDHEERFYDALDQLDGPFGNPAVAPQNKSSKLSDVQKELRKAQRNHAKVNARCKELVEGKALVDAEITTLKEENTALRTRIEEKDVEMATLQAELSGTRKDLDNKHYLLQAAEYLEKLPNKVVDLLNTNPELADHGITGKVTYQKLMCSIAKEMTIAQEKTATKKFETLTSKQALRRLKKQKTHREVFKALAILDAPVEAWFGYYGIKTLRNIFAHCKGWIQLEFVFILTELAETLPAPPYFRSIPRTLPEDITVVSRLEPWWTWRKAEKVTAAGEASSATETSAGPVTTKPATVLDGMDLLGDHDDEEDDFIDEEEGGV